MSADPGVVVGLLPVCARRGGKIVNRTKKLEDLIKQEQKLSDEGRLADKFQFHPLSHFHR